MWNVVNLLGAQGTTIHDFKFLLKILTSVVSKETLESKLNTKRQQKQELIRRVVNVIVQKSATKP